MSMDKFSRRSQIEEAHSVDGFSPKKESKSKLSKLKNKSRGISDCPRKASFVPLLGPSPLNGQKLFNAMSEPTVCGYPLPVSCYPFDPVAVPFYRVLHTPMSHAYDQKFNVRNQQKMSEEYISIPSDKDNEDYTSLPSRNGINNVPSDQQRRFSDPGLINALNEELSSQSTESLSNHFSEQLSNLTAENERLKKEIQSTKDDLKELKTEISWLLESKQSYSPGIITEMIQEVRKAAELRETALFMKAQQLIKETITNQDFKNSSHINDDKYVPKHEFEEMKAKLAEVISEKELLSHKFGILEKIVSDMSSRETRQCNRQLHMEQEKLLARKQIQESIEAQKHGNLLNWCHNQCRQKLSNGFTYDDKDKPESINSLDTNESLSSGVSRGSVPSPVVTMSGPVTDV